jgi:hypothetical protein
MSTVLVYCTQHAVLTHTVLNILYSHMLYSHILYPAHVADAAVGAALASAAITQMFAIATGNPLGTGTVGYLEVGLYLIQQQGAIIQASPLGRSLYGGETAWSRELFRRVFPLPAGTSGSCSFDS